MKKQPKSQRAITHAFIELRKKTPLEKMTVTGLCKYAEINKSTFYVYYKDIYDLSDKMEDEVVKRITTSIKHTNIAFEDPALFSEDVFKAYDENSELISILFSDSQAGNLPKKLHASLTNLLFTLRPEYINSPEKHVMFSYMIYGSYYAFMENNEYDHNYLISVISSLITM